MKKILEIGTGILGSLFVIAGILIKINGNAVVSKIGGADGPTSVFVAEKLGSGFVTFLIIVGILLLTAAAVFYWNRKH